MHNYWNVISSFFPKDCNKSISDNAGGGGGSVQLFGQNTCVWQGHYLYVIRGYTVQVIYSIDWRLHRHYCVDFVYIHALFSKMDFLRGVFRSIFKIIEKKWKYCR